MPARQIRSLEKVPFISVSSTTSSVTIKAGAILGYAALRAWVLRPRTAVRLSAASSDIYAASEPTTSKTAPSVVGSRSRVTSNQLMTLYEIRMKGLRP